LHGVGGELADGEHGVVNLLVVMDELHRGDGLGELAANEISRRVFHGEAGSSV
jgi:hypothetical protein